MATQEERIKAKRERAISISRGSSGEPIVTKENYDVDIANAFSYYNVHSDKKDKREWLLAHFSGNKEKVKLIKDAADYQLRQIAVIVRLQSRNQYVSDDHAALIETQLKEIEKKASEKVQDEDSDQDKRVNNRNEIVCQQLIADVLNEIDLFCEKKTTSFDITSFLAANNVNKSNSKRIAERLGGLHKELTELLERTDEQLEEGWSFLTKSQQKSLFNFVDDIIEKCKQSVVKPRKVRAKKVIPPQMQVAHVKYRKDINEDGVNLKSINPVDILKSKELWVYNTKNRILSVYKSKAGLQVKGTSLLDWDVKESRGRRLRKPEVFFSGALAKASMNDAFSKLTTIEFEPNGRINADCIIVKAF